MVKRLPVARSGPGRNSRTSSPGALPGSASPESAFLGVQQKRRWLPEMARMDKIGAFGLTEPEVGSGVAGHAGDRRLRP